MTEVAPLQQDFTMLSGGDAISMEPHMLAEATDSLPQQISNDPCIADGISLVTESCEAVVEEARDEVEAMGGEVEVDITVAAETKSEDMSSPDDGMVEEEDEGGVDESSDSVEIVEEAMPEIVVVEVKEVKEVHFADDTEAPAVTLEFISEVKASPLELPVSSKKESGTESSGKDDLSGAESSDKETGSEEDLLVAGEVETTEVPPPEETKKGYPLIHFICSLVLMGCLLFLSLSKDNEPDTVTIALSTLYFAYLTTFAAADLQMVSPESVVPGLIAAFNSVVCPFVLTFLLAYPALYPDDVGLMTPVLAWLLGVELWVQFDRLQWQNVVVGVVVAVSGLGIHECFIKSAEENFFESEDNETI